jgi:hypothetical protein
MKRSVPAALAAFLVAGALLLESGPAAAQSDLAKVLLGSWQGELQGRFKKGAAATTEITLRIVSVKQEDGKWVGDGRVGRTPVKIDIDTSGSKPALRWTGATGFIYEVSLFDENTLSGTATLTREVAAGYERERPVRLEKK